MLTAPPKKNPKNFSRYAQKTKNKHPKAQKHPQKTTKTPKNAKKKRQFFFRADARKRTSRVKKEPISHVTRNAMKPKKIPLCNITALSCTLTSLWVLGEGGLCCIATALRGLGHQRRREMVRSDKFVGPFANVMKSWVTWVLRSIWPDVPL